MERSIPIYKRIMRRDWIRLIPFFDYPADIRRAIYTTNAIESLNMTLRKVIKNKCMFPIDEAVFKLLYLHPRDLAHREKEGSLFTVKAPKHVIGFRIFDGKAVGFKAGTICSLSAY